MFTIEIMFIALIVWSFTTYLHVSFAGINHKTAAKKEEEVWQSKLSSVALRFGLIGKLCLAFLFFPVTRGSSILSLIVITSSIGRNVVSLEQLAKVLYGRLSKKV
ncbi:putative ferric-chelate reductase (NADH) [Helianthus annuus]|nr:putative ferric-chelate reductase (NADH) [Helianthus annuus]